jgi:hypothetical protein
MSHMLQAKYNITDDAIGILPLVLDMKVMIVDNVMMQGKVANRCVGTVENVKFKINNYGHQRAICAYVHIPGAMVHASDLPLDIVPILPEVNLLKYKDTNGKLYKQESAALGTCLCIHS